MKVLSEKECKATFLKAFGHLAELEVLEDCRRTCSSVRPRLAPKASIRSALPHLHSSIQLGRSYILPRGRPVAVFRTRNSTSSQYNRSRGRGVESVERIAAGPDDIQEERSFASWVGASLRRK